MGKKLVIFPDIQIFADKAVPATEATSMDMIFQDPGRGVFHPFFKKFRKPENALYCFPFSSPPGCVFRKLGQDLPESGCFSSVKNS